MFGTFEHCSVMCDRFVSEVLSERIAKAAFKNVETFPFHLT